MKNACKTKPCPKTRRPKYLGIAFGRDWILLLNFHHSLAPQASRRPRPVLCDPQTNSFIRAKAELELAQYMLKSDDLMLHPEFLQRLRSLPQSYIYGEYRQIYRDYGTHYITEATLGGDYEHTIILNKEKLEKTGTGMVTTLLSGMLRDLYFPDMSSLDNYYYYYDYLLMKQILVSGPWCPRLHTTSVQV